MDACMCKQLKRIFWQAGTTHETSRDDEMLAFAQSPVFCFDMPFALSNIELCTNNNSLEGAILLDVEDFVDVIKISSQLLVVWIIGGPCPVLVYFWPRELILRYLRVNSRSRIAVPSPGPGGGS